jgi:hypothetical protein
MYLRADRDRTRPAAWNAERVRMVFDAELWLWAVELVDFA